jgi:hypothetical protein
MKFHSFLSTLSALALCMGLGLSAQQQAAPPELAELRAAAALTDDQARLKELQRLKAAYPNSP